ncbi:MAG TPA: MarR family transcriptional regulator [Fimbriimonadaceae bacterium]|nr:MarR family transcriptional regulator [Fimbriimonadaceae bacterium]
MTTELSKQGLEAWKGLLLAHATLVEQIDKEMAQADLLPLDWYDALLALEDAPNHKLKMSELADQVLLSKSGLTRLVDRLEAKGYIRREGCRADRRVAYAVLTPEGLKAREASWPTYRTAIQEHFASQLTEEEARVVAEALLKFVGRYRKRIGCGGHPAT